MVLNALWPECCREAGATVRCNVRLRDMNVAVSITDMCSLHCGPLSHLANADKFNGAVLVKARADKERSVLRNWQKQNIRATKQANLSKRASRKTSCTDGTPGVWHWPAVEQRKTLRNPVLQSTQALRSTDESTRL